MLSDRYYRFSQYLRGRGFARGVRKVTVDAGFPCPNRDGTLSSDGCIFCDNRAFSPAAGSLISVAEQARRGAQAIKARYGPSHLLVYFQTNTFTSVPVDRMRAAIDEALAVPGVIGFAAGTRPDCVSDEALALIGSYAAGREVWMEYGLQSAHDATLAAIKRNHAVKDFVSAVEGTRRYPGIKICAHVILGLPGETPEMMMQTADLLAGLRIDGVKIHPLYAVKGTGLDRRYRAGAWKPLEMEEYARLAVRFIERLPVEIVIQRLGADCPREMLVAPEWIHAKTRLLDLIDRIMEEEDTRQGKRRSKLGV